MTKLRDEFQKIVNSVIADSGESVPFYVAGLDAVALRIQEYIDAKEPVMLTYEETKRVQDMGCGWEERNKYALNIQRAFIAKQRQPQKRTVTVYVYADENGNIFATTDQKCMSPPAANLIDTIVKEYDV